MILTRITVGLNWSETVKKMPEKLERIFGTFEHPELVLREIFLIPVWLPGGAEIIFAQSCNFELKFFLDIPFTKKLVLGV